jgi:hypothetical protein
MSINKHGSVTTGISAQYEKLEHEKNLNNLKLKQ